MVSKADEMYTCKRDSVYTRSAFLSFFFSASKILLEKNPSADSEADFRLAVL